MKATLEGVLSLVATQLGVDRVTEHDHILEDLGAESGDLLNIVTAIEERYGIAIDDSEIDHIGTVGDLYRAVSRQS